MSKVCASVMMEALVFMVLLAGAYSVMLNMLPTGREKNSVKVAIQDLNKLLGELVATSVEKQVVTRIFFAIKDKKVNCFGQIYDGSSFDGSKFKPLVFKSEILPFLGPNQESNDEFSIDIDSCGVVRPLPIKLKVVDANNRNVGNEIVLDWLSSKLVYKK